MVHSKEIKQTAKRQLIVGDDGKKRCFGGEAGKEYYAEYHDKEWGIPVYEDRKLFEMLILEGSQAGLSWETILKRREEYRKAFYDFNVEKVAAMSDEELNELVQNSGIIRHRLKIYATRRNAQLFLKLQEEFGSFAKYLWAFVGGRPIINRWKDFTEMPVKTLQSDQLSRDLKRRGMSYVGSKIIYAYMQGVGLVNDHLVDCWCGQK